MVWLASYPKSGSTWLRSVYTALARRGDFRLNDLMGGAQPSGRAFFDTALGLRSSDLSFEEIDDLRPAADEATSARVSGDRWRKVHDALSVGPGGRPIVSPAATRAAIYLVRDPRDVVVSWAHHSGQSLQWSVEFICDPASALCDNPAYLGRQLRQKLGSWSGHVRSWVDQSFFPVHVLRYEDCARGPVRAFRRAFAAGGLQYSEEEVGAAVEMASFERLRAQEQSEGFAERSARDIRFFRRGVAGAWQEELPAPLARRVANEHAEVMARFGYPT
jgi:aryl sulfotransferase